jgi:DNA-binding response OmpR family regulator
MMPIKDGFSLAEQIRKTDKTTPLIFITAKSLKSDKLKWYNIGANNYITKPFDKDELV